MSDQTTNKPDNLVAKSGLFAGMNPLMGILSMVMIIGFVLYTIMDVERSSEVFALGKDFIINTMDWFYVIVVNVALFFVFWLLVSRFGDVKLGKDDDEPDFSTFSWICMLFSAGLGSGLIYWGVAEPMYHIQGSPFMERAGAEAGSVDAAISAVTVTNFHWGFHGWGLYVLVGLSLAYFSYRRDLPLTLRTALYPVLKDKIYGPWGHLVDLIGVFGTIFGLATSLGLGVTPIAAGLENLGWMSNTQTNQLILVAIITCLGTASAASGVGKGVRILSECNVMASIGLLILFIILGPTAFLLGITISGFGDYLWNVIPMGFWINGDPENQWQSWWTIFYWGWWIAWCPFVGLFIARVSKGRTIRQFCFCVLLIPTSVVMLWMGVFGGAAAGVDLFYGAGVMDAVNDDYAAGVFKTVAGFGYSWLTYPITVLITILLISWFVTSSDSGTLVMCTMLSMGDENPPVKFRIFWGLTAGIVAGVLMLAGGLSALQTASIVAGLPIAVILLFMTYGMVKSLYEDHPAPDVEDKYDLEFLNR
ncbi:MULTISPECIES: BCCT family transporter [unclassified Roseovarius]|uniref:BCCT family transporter n=1 Tax=unclassified Roseovarius TaxID=2614913 RepID=UPI00273F8683|nr:MULTISPECIES: BCCT family transporter [unclassified Roseovarius]